MIPSTVDRVPLNTSECVNRKIIQQIEENVAHVAAQGSAAIERRLMELDYEWDIERVLAANASIAVLVGSTLGLTVNRKFFAIPMIVGGFFLQHAIQGWCPPLPVWRRLGVRTESEINYERYALKACRGDFDHVREGGSAVLAARR